MTVLVTGGAGFIGSHTIVELQLAGHQVVVVDNLCNSQAESLKRVQQITGQAVAFYQADICDKAALTRIFGEHQILQVIHFAGLKAVGESSQIPLSYYQNNIAGTLTLLEVMAAHGVFDLVFSSSATVYSPEAKVPLTESSPLAAINPYGRTKLMLEQVLADLAASDNRWRIWLLRYFNPIGAHPSGLIGEDPNGIPNNLVPYVARVAIGRLPELPVFGDDYPTPDGTGVRDYIHVVDLARGHLKAMENMGSGCQVVNLGTGQGYSVMDVVKAYREVSGAEINVAIKPRRAGDLATCYADPAKAAEYIGWRAEFDLRTMVEDSWRWTEQNPAGYGS
ncbi:UDP-glucose 4-epimerase GalE [Simiduia sp. 21SJ11W-1]|uniref:UDP-glucose 4-epimerase GalE n=1 Tax=Simiduia sp. 21SJ11W-1 TaxID=2909669 RepID=UPI00209F1825|nr:UDP-glucose 4-epimerase GalE [Simiduia sp. 21SJ11W-1]UTA48610.1 UDP-glucose 4-epimerase GalE [Simiduia sp. 21SJ11W-1]